MIEKPSPVRRSGGGSNAATWLALAGLAVVSVGLLGLAALVMPQVLGIVLVLAILFLPAVFHYFIWGKWLSEMRDDSDEAGQEDERL